MAAALAILTVFATAMIYASLKPIRAWRNLWVVPNYLVLAAMTGGLWLATLLHGFGLAHPPLHRSGGEIQVGAGQGLHAARRMLATIN